MMHVAWRAAANTVADDAPEKAETVEVKYNSQEQLVTVKTFSLQDSSDEDDDDGDDDDGGGGGGGASGGRTAKQKEHAAMRK